MKRLISKTCIGVLLCLTVACGSRKVQTDISKNKTTQDVKSTEQVITQEGSQSKAIEANTGNQTSNSEADKITTVKKYDKDTGVLIEERNVIDKGKKSKTKQQTSTKNFEQTDYKLTDMRRTITTHITVKTLDKSKTTDRNSSIWIVLSGLAGLALGIWLSPKVARWFGR
jgi:mannose-6-phosphate isomerase-like protein (cupin superfamily)